MTIENRINNFKEDLSGGKLTEEQIFQKHILDSNSHLFTTELDSNTEILVKQRVSNYLKTDLQTINLVGSAKVGFSMSPKNLFNHLDHYYNISKKSKDKSDLDIAIVSERLFERVGKSVFNFSNAYRVNWNKNEYYDNETSNIFPVSLKYKYFEFYTKGWFRPDFKPDGFEICYPQNYETLKREIYKLTKRKASIAIYKNWFYFKSYHMDNIKFLKNQVETDTL